MSRLRSGVWIYFLTLSVILILGLLIGYRKQHPLSNPQTLLKIKPQSAFLVDNPCANSIYGEPFISPDDSYLKVYFYCPDGTKSTNTLRFSALPSKKLFEILNLIEDINNFDILYDDHNQILALGSIKNNQTNHWHITINSQPVITSLNETLVIPNNVIEIKYE